MAAVNNSVFLVKIVTEYVLVLWATKKNWISNAHRTHHSQLFLKWTWSEDTALLTRLTLLFPFRGQVNINDNNKYIL